MAGPGLPMLPLRALERDEDWVEVDIGCGGGWGRGEGEGASSTGRRDGVRVGRLLRAVTTAGGEAARGKLVRRR